MAYAERQALYRQIETDRKSKVLTFVTSDRLGEYWPNKPVSTIMADDAIPPFVDLLDQVGPSKKISLILHTAGGQTLTAWRLVNLVKSFADDFEVLIPLRATSAGTMIAIGADRIIMTKQAVLGPIDPSVNHPLNPQVNNARVPVSVEGILKYLNTVQKELGVLHRRRMTEVVVAMNPHLHPLVLGEALRSRAQIRFLARKLLKTQFPEAETNLFRRLLAGSASRRKVNTIVDFLCSDSGSHDYTINRREARAMGLSLETPSESLYRLIRDVQLDYARELHLTEPYSGEVLLAQQNPAQLSEHRGLIESTEGGSYCFLTEGTVTRLPQPGQYTTTIATERWTKLP